MHMKSKLRSLNLSGKKVFLRADLNVPLADGNIEGDFRLKAILPTLTLLIQKGAKIIIGTHIGRPVEHDNTLSTKQLLPWFIGQGYDISWAASLDEAHGKAEKLQPGSILLLENLRFDEREHHDCEKNSKNKLCFRSESSNVPMTPSTTLGVNGYLDMINPPHPASRVIDEAHAPSQLYRGTLCFDQNSSEEMMFAQELQSLAEYYVNDAFGLLHRCDTSISLLASLYAPDHKTIGMLVEKEIAALNALLARGKYVLMLGGGKAKDKLPYLERLIPSLEACILLPAVAFPALHAEGVNLGSTTIDTSLVEVAKHVIETAKKHNVPLILPSDFLIAEPKKTIGQPASTTKAMSPPQEVAHTGVLKVSKEIGPESAVLSVGPETIERCREILEKAQAIFVNGLSGFLEEPKTTEPYIKLLQSITNGNAYSIVGGGESVAAVFFYNLENRISYCSTGGGASLYYLGHKALPALKWI